LADTNDLDAESPQYFTDSYRLINELIDKAVLDPDDGQQIQTYVEGLSRADPSFKFRRGIDSNGNIIGYIWQMGVMQCDIELYGSTLFLDRLDHSLNSKGWPLMTIAMLSGEKKVCLPCGAIAVGESTN
jgi:hypothetical protein